MAIFGYARVSTRDQDVAAQVAELMTAGCAKVYREKASGAKTDRPELRKIIGRLEPGDVLMVTRLDRLARSTRDLLNVIEEVSKRGAGFKSLKDAWADKQAPGVVPRGVLRRLRGTRRLCNCESASKPAVRLSQGRRGYLAEASRENRKPIERAER